MKKAQMKSKGNRRPHSLDSTIFFHFFFYFIRLIFSFVSPRLIMAINDCEQLIVRCPHIRGGVTEPRAINDEQARILDENRFESRREPEVL